MTTVAQTGPKAKSKSKAKAKGRTTSAGSAGAFSDSDIINRVISRNALAPHDRDVAAIRRESRCLRTEQQADAAAALDLNVDFPPLPEADRRRRATAPVRRLPQQDFRLGPPFPRYEPRECMAPKSSIMFTPEISILLDSVLRVLRYSRADTRWWRPDASVSLDALLNGEIFPFGAQQFTSLTYEELLILTAACPRSIEFSPGSEDGDTTLSLRPPWAFSLSLNRSISILSSPC